MPAPAPTSASRARVRASRARVRASQLVTLIVLTASTLLLGSAPAWAHTELTGSTPAANASLPTAPTTVALTFSEEISPDLATITVTGPDGQRYESGGPTASGATLNLALRPLGPAGAYEVDYRVVSDDGHPVAGAVPFTLTTAGPGAAPTAAAAPSAAGSAASSPPAAGSAASSPPAASSAPAPADAAATAEDSGSPVWPWIVGAVIVVLAGAGLALRRRKA